jgi:hypothetical protein
VSAIAGRTTIFSRFHFFGVGWFFFPTNSGCQQWGQKISLPWNSATSSMGRLQDGQFIVLSSGVLLYYVQNNHCDRIKERFARRQAHKPEKCPRRRFSPPPRIFIADGRR